MGVLGIILFLVVIGMLLPLLPLEDRIKNTIITLVIIVAVLWLLVALGLLPMHDVGVPRIR